MSDSLLRVTGVAKRFGPVVTARDVSFEVAAGEALGLVGPNGAGKTTLLDIVGGTQRADAGTVVLDGRDITRLGAAARADRGIARSYQVPRPFGGLTVYENVLVGASFAGQRHARTGPADDAGAQAWHALEVTGMTEVANTPSGSLRLLDRKRLEVARALATRPRLLLLDEIAGGLTDRELPQVVRLVRSLRDDGVAVVWIEHVLHALLDVVDRLMCLAAGEVIAQGDPHDVIRSPEVIEVYLGSTVDAVTDPAPDPATTPPGETA
ncbi:branched-chain amino acid transport system ATP-binding protein [Promicromonospora umidemergens]|uniref:ABC transporter ATP-binding protein n=1 Tax=Promicromonospora umidemergens TaxID=629679 RepID=UPI0020A4C220|nr:ABC transporter ATP-binding protein [Promicromonospora umidemergens]MCP2285851.1 branched-chain amino acid transport system ATP-binding protein [Promicromonospora umidemergens]